MAHRGRSHNFGEVVLRSLAQGLVSGQQGLLFDLENRRRTEQADRLFGLEQDRVKISQERLNLQREEFDLGLTGKFSPAFGLEDLGRQKTEKEIEKLESEIGKLNAQTANLRDVGVSGDALTPAESRQRAKAFRGSEQTRLAGNLVGILGGLDPSLAERKIPNIATNTADALAVLQGEVTGARREGDIGGETFSFADPGATATLDSLRAISGASIGEIESGDPFSRVQQPVHRLLGFDSIEEAIADWQKKKEAGTITDDEFDELLRAVGAEEEGFNLQFRSPITF